MRTLPATPKSKASNRKWLLYAAGAGALLALIVLIAKRKSSSEGEATRIASPSEGAAGASGGEGNLITSALGAFSQDLQKQSEEAAKNNAALAAEFETANATTAREFSTAITGLQNSQAAFQGKIESQYNAMSGQTSSGSGGGGAAPQGGSGAPQVSSQKAQPKTAINNDAGNPRKGLAYKTTTYKGKAAHDYGKRVAGGVGPNGSLIIV